MAALKERNLEESAARTGRRTRIVPRRTMVRSCLEDVGG